jgi:hypothetical protein
MNRRRRVYTLACLTAGFNSRIIWHSLIELHNGWFIGSHRPKKPCLKFGNRGERRLSWLRQCVTVREVPGSIPDRDIDNFQVTYSFCAHSETLESTHKSVGKVRPLPGADNSAVLLVRNIRVRLSPKFHFSSEPSWLLGGKLLKIQQSQRPHYALMFSTYLASIVLNTQMSENISIYSLQL